MDHRNKKIIGYNFHSSDFHENIFKANCAVLESCSLFQISLLIWQISGVNVDPPLARNGSTEINRQITIQDSAAIFNELKPVLHKYTTIFTACFYAHPLSEYTRVKYHLLQSVLHRPVLLIRSPP